MKRDLTVRKSCHIPHPYHKFSQHTEFQLSKTILKFWDQLDQISPNFRFEKLILQKLFYFRHSHPKLRPRAKFYLYTTILKFWDQLDQIYPNSQFKILILKNYFTFVIFILNLVHVPNFIVIRPF